MPIVDVFMRELICDQHTSEAGVGRIRDEVYIQVFGSTPNGNISARLPRSHYGDDYYTFYDNQVSRADNLRSWVNQDGSLMEAPQIWSGELRPNRNDKADLFVLIAEQDNLQLQNLRNVLLAGLNNLNVGNNAMARAGIVAARQIVQQIPDSHDDIIGLFHIHLRVVQNRINVTWLPLVNFQYRETRGQTTLTNSNDHYATALGARGHLVQSFNFRGVVGGRYRGVAEVNVRNQGSPARAHRYLITEFDACSRSNDLRLYDYDPTKVPPILRPRHIGTVRPGGVMAFPVSQRTWFWRCGNSGFETTKGAHTGIRYVIANRNPGSGQIRWHCFNNEDW